MVPQLVYGRHVIAASVGLRGAALSIIFLSFELSISSPGAADGIIFIVVSMLHALALNQIHTWRPLPIYENASGNREIHVEKTVEQLSISPLKLVRPSFFQVNGSAECSCFQLLHG